MARSIEQLENDYWPEPDPPYPLALKVHQLRKKPIDQFDVEELRLMIGQNTGTQYLMSRALGMLEQTPLVTDYHFPGEVLYSVLKLPNAYWRTHPDHLQRARNVAQLALNKLVEICERQKAYALRKRGEVLNDHKCLDRTERMIQELAMGFLAVHGSNEQSLAFLPRQL